MSSSAKDLTDDFDRFWAAYPRKVGKQAARREWQKLRPTPALIDKMLESLSWQRTQAQWTKAGGQYIPHPSTYLSQHRFEDEPMDRPTLSDTAQYNRDSLEQALQLIEEADRKRRDGN